MAITGAHMLLYTSKPDEVRGIMRDVFGWQHVDAGQGWLIFKLPPAEIGVHPSDPGAEPMHQFALMCDDIHKTVTELKDKAVVVEGDPEDHGWGITVMLKLPGDLAVMLYEPRHPTAI